MSILKKLVTLAIVGCMSLSIATTCFAKEDPTAGMSVKEKITYYKNHASDEEKSETLLVFMKEDNIDEITSKVATQYDFNKIEIVSKHFSTLLGGYLCVIECDSVKESDIAVDLFNAFDEVEYAEPDYDRSPCI